MSDTKLMILIDLAILIVLCADVYLSYQNFQMQRGAYVR